MLAFRRGPDTPGQSRFCVMCDRSWESFDAATRAFLDTLCLGYICGECVRKDVDTLLAGVREQIARERRYLDGLETLAGWLHAESPRQRRQQFRIVAPRVVGGT